MSVQGTGTVTVTPVHHLDSAKVLAPPRSWREALSPFPPSLPPSQMLMDVFVHTAPPEYMVRRTHFHDFMLGIHKKLRHFKGKDDQVMRVADHLVQVGSGLWCLGGTLVARDSWHCRWRKTWFRCG